MDHRIRMFYLNWAARSTDQAACLYECALWNRSGMISSPGGIEWECISAAELVGRQAGEAFRLAELAYDIRNWLKDQ